MSLTQNGEAIVLNALLAARHISAHTSAPPAGEIVDMGYARQAATFTNSGNGPTTAANSAVIEFPVATGEWGTITHCGIWSAATGGNLLAIGVLEAPKTIQSGDVLRFRVGELRVIAD